jgi:hypothetical protein
MQKPLYLRQSRMEQLEAGQKVNTIRVGRRDIQLGELTLHETDNDAYQVTVTVHEVKFTTFDRLDESDAVDGGYSDVDSMRDTLRSIYPQVTGESEMTVISFEPMLWAATKRLIAT